MLNLRPIFIDAFHAFSEHEAHLAIPSLPATVFLMQTDVINHYRYALTHYLPLKLNEHFLQNSSIGSPYEKWAKFTNEDFDMLAFTVTNLIRYTSRLIRETEGRGFEAANQYAELKKIRSNDYISPLVEINHFDKQVGIHANDNETLSVTPFATESVHEGAVRMRGIVDGPTERFHVTVDDDGNEHERSISLKEYRQLTQSLQPNELNIHNRFILGKLVADGLGEVESLVGLNRQFGDLCNSYNSKHEVACQFDKLNESWWV